MRLDDRAHSRGRPRENAMMNTRRDRYSRRDFSEFHFRMSFRAYDEDVKFTKRIAFAASSARANACVSDRRSSSWTAV